MNARARTALENASTLFLGLALIVLPLQQLWLRIIETKLDQPLVELILTSWSGPFVAILGLIALVFLIAQRLYWADRFFLAFMAIVAAQVFWHPDLSVGYVLGLRYGILASFFYFLGRTLLAKTDWDNMLRWVTRAALGVAAIQFLLWLLKADSLAGALQLQEYFYAGPMARLYGSLAGPNQLGTFLAVSGLWLYCRKKINLSEFLILAVFVGLTFSRSAMLGLLVGWMLPALFQLGRIRSMKLLPVTLILLVIGSILIFNLDSFRSVLVESRNYEERIGTLTETWSGLSQFSPIELSFGLGAGSSGPANLVSGGGLIPENWFIQIIYEYGLIGLGLLLGFFITSILITWRAGLISTAAIVLAMMVNSLFLHPLSDNFTAASWFYLLVGWSVTRSGQGVAR